MTCNTLLTTTITAKGIEIKRKKILSLHLKVIKHKKNRAKACGTL